MCHSFSQPTMSVIQSKIEPFQTHTPAPITLAYISVSSCYANPQKDLFQDQELFMKTRATISDVSGGAIYSPLGDITRPSPLTHYLNGNRGLANGPQHKSITIACWSSRWSLAEWARHFLLSNFSQFYYCFFVSNLAMNVDSELQEGRLHWLEITRLWEKKEEWGEFVIR